MTNSKQTRKALYSSVLSLLLCFVMLIGTTFAWFTDTASTSVNKIQAGTLDIQLLDANEKSLEGKTLTWQKASGHTDEAVLWEPGATYSLQDVTVKNNGNLALKYKVAITGIDGDEKLNEAIDWTIKVGNDDYTTGKEISLGAKATNTLTISGTMKKEAGNQYQGLSIEGVSITVYATQDTVEYDSKTNKYDEDATYAPMANVSALENKDIKAKVNNANTAEDYKLDTAYSFKTTETSNQANAGNYAKYHADFVVKADKDVAANSIMLAGYYESFCTDGNWIGFKNNEKVEAGQEIRLLKLKMGDTTVNYSDLCSLVQEFKCGAKDLAGNNKGTTLTVELRLYEIKAGVSSTAPISAETGDYIVIGTYSYTF